MGLSRFEIQENLYKLYSEKGFLTENDIDSCCEENEVDLFDVDKIIQFLIDKKVIIKDSSTVQEEDDIYDKSQVDFDSFYNEVLERFPEQSFFINDLKKIQPPQKNEWQILIPKAKQGNEYARQRIISMYLRSVYRHAYYFSISYGCDIDTSLENGIFGLIKSIDAYDITSPNSFPGYYGYYVLASMQRNYKKSHSSFDIPNHIYGDMLTFISEYKEVVSKYGINQLFDFVNNDEILDLRRKSKALYKYLSPTINYDFNLIKYNAKIEENCIYNDLHNTILKILNNLKPKEKDIILKRFGLVDGNELTLEEIGKIHNVTRERIRQIEAKALKKLRLPSSLQYLDGFYERKIINQENTDLEMWYTVKLIDFYSDIICYDKDEFEKYGYIIESNEFSEYSQ